MKELLAPAGSSEAFYAAVSNGANAIYLGLSTFSARAYAENFSIDTLKEFVNYAHLRNVKVYVAMNTILYDYELDNAYDTVDKLAEIGVDAIIVQDLALLDYITSNYQSIEAHISTQVGIDDIYGVTFVKNMGSTRCVLAREVNIKTIDEIKKLIDIEIETFIHGALCVSYSGNCFMSGLLGMRSGNRGRCVGCCRKLYKLKNNNTLEVLMPNYILSMKDLNTSSNILNFNSVDSFKIEGRMKEPSYVAGIVRYYRELLDGKKPNKAHLFKNFQRTFTKGYISGEDPENITNIEKPNNYGYLVGEVINVYKGKVTIKLCNKVNQHDQLRLETKPHIDEISFPLTKMYDNTGNLINESNSIIHVYLKEKAYVGQKVYKTKDVNYLKDITKTFHEDYQKLPITFNVFGEIGKPLTITLAYNNIKVNTSSEYLIETAKTTGVTEENFTNLLEKLNDTPYYLKNVNVKFPTNGFVPLKIISSMKRDLIEKLNNKRLVVNVLKKEPKKIKVPEYKLPTPVLTCEVETIDQYNACIEQGIETIYYQNKVSRNNSTYVEGFDRVLVGGLNGVEYYKDKCLITTDYSLNIVNHESLRVLHEHGVDTVTLSYEINKTDINALIENYYDKYEKYPKVELIVYGRQKLMVTKYCPLKRMGMCGKCKTDSFSLVDEFAEFPLGFKNCEVTLYNSKVLNLIDDLKDFEGISSYRLSFTKETKDETTNIIKMFKERLNNLDDTTKLFDSKLNTRGHLNKEIM